MRHTIANGRPFPLLLVPRCLILVALAACGGAATERSGEPATASLDGLSRRQSYILYPDPPDGRSAFAR